MSGLATAGRRTTNHADVETPYLRAREQNGEIGYDEQVFRGNSEDLIVEAQKLPRGEVPKHGEPGIYRGIRHFANVVYDQLVLVVGLLPD